MYSCLLHISFDLQCRYLHSVVRENDNMEQFAFCDPGATFTLNSDFEANLVSRFKEGNPDRLFLLPHNSK